MDLLSFMSSLRCCKNFPLKINFSESNFLEVYAVVNYIATMTFLLRKSTMHGLLNRVINKTGEMEALATRVIGL